MEKSEKAGSHQCPATELQQPDNHQPPQSVISLPDPPPPQRKKKKKAVGLVNRLGGASSYTLYTMEILITTEPFITGRAFKTHTETF